MPVDDFQRLALALAIGLLVGVERGWNARDAAEGSRTAGLRTHALIGLLGGIAGELGKALGGWALVALALPFSAAFILFKWREQQADEDYSVTAVVAALLVFALGAYAVVGDWRLAAAAAVAVTGLLAFKSVLHAWLRKLTWPELRSAIVLLVMSFVALPLLPDEALGPFGALNPYDLWRLTIILAGLSFVAYVAIRLFGQAKGAVLAALLGALVSSTAATLDLARRTRKAPQAALINGGAGLMVGAVMAGRIAVVLGILAPAMLVRLLPAGLAFILVSTALGLIAVWRGRRSQNEGEAAALGNPFELGSVIKFALLLGAVTAIARAASALLGPQSLLAVAAVAGLVDVDAITVTAARMAGEGSELAIAGAAVLVAAGVNTLSKGLMALGIGGRRFGLIVLGGSVLAALAAAAVWLLLPPIALDLSAVYAAGPPA